MLRVAPEQSLIEAKFPLARFARLVEGNPITAESRCSAAPSVVSIPARIEFQTTR